MKSLLRFAVIAAALSSWGYAQQPSDVHVLRVQGNVYMLVGAGGNIAVQVGSDGVLMVDTGSAQMTDQVLAAVKQTTFRSLRHRHALAAHRHRALLAIRAPSARASSLAHMIEGCTRR